MSGRHRNGAGASSRTVLIVLVGVALAAVGITGARALMSTDSSTDTVATSSTAGSSASPTTPATSPSQTPLSSPTTASEAVAPASLVACKAEVTAGDALAKAAHTSWAHWVAHTGAQASFDRGRTTLAQTKAIWASSKATADQDLIGVARAQAAYKRVAGACAKVGVVPDAHTAAAKACATRSAALSNVAATGAKVNADWATHVAMMANKAHTDGAAYHTRWVQMVKTAPANQVAFQKAYVGYSTTPGCPRVA